MIKGGAAGIPQVGRHWKGPEVEKFSLRRPGNHCRLMGCDMSSKITLITACGMGRWAQDRSRVNGQEAPEVVKARDKYQLGLRL